MCPHFLETAVQRESMSPLGPHSYKEAELGFEPRSPDSLKLSLWLVRVVERPWVGKSDVIAGLQYFPNGQRPSLCLFRNS